jgi:hypothetical protein
MYDPHLQAMRLVVRHASTAFAVAAIAGLAACSDSTNVRNNGASQLGFSTASTTSTVAGASLAEVPITKNGHTLDLKQVTVVIERAELKRQNNDACRGDDDEHDSKWSGRSESCAEVKVGPTLVDLPLDGSVVTVPASVIPGGTFQEIEFKISLARLVGTFDTKAFDVTFPINAKAEIEFSTPLVVTDSTPTSITINIPITAWLTNADGSLVDPSTLLTNPTVAAAVKARIMATFKAFEDNDHDGHEDHNRSGDHGGDG